MRRIVALIALLALAACSGSGRSNSGALPGTTTPATGGAATAPLVATTFTFGKLNPTTAAMRRAQYLTSNVASVTIVLTAVNGVAPTAAPGLETSVTSPLNPATCPCTISGPSVPPGPDTFTLTTYDGAGATGNVISTATTTTTIVAGMANPISITLNGVPASVTFGALPGATAGTAFGGAQALAVTVKDADNGTIMGAYSTPVTLSDSDTSGATTLATSGTDSPGTLQLKSSSDSVTLNYTGLAIASATLGASVTGTATFTPTLQPITFTPSATLSLTNTIGTASLNASEVGWTNAPYNMPLTVSVPANCSTIGSASAGANSTTTGTPINATVATTPSNGSCSLTLSDGSGPRPQQVTLTYTGAAMNSQTFSTPGTSTFTVPAGVTSVTISASGAQGGTGGGGSGLFAAGSAGGLGAVVTATVAVTPGSMLTVNVGGQGGSLTIDTFTMSPMTYAGLAGGTGGGGAGGSIMCPLGGTGACDVLTGGSGGGASSVVGPTPSLVLLVTAGGGGGGGALCGSSAGGAGGYPTGNAGLAGCGSSGAGGGATASAGGSGGGTGGAGSPGSGGAGGSFTDNVGAADVAGAGGGAGYFGGGGGGTTTGNPFALTPTAGAGGGSSYAINSATGVSGTAVGTNTGNGSVTITW